MGVDGRWVPLPPLWPSRVGRGCRATAVGSDFGVAGGPWVVPHAAQFRRLVLSLCRMVTVFVYARLAIRFIRVAGFAPCVGYRIWMLWQSVVLLFWFSSVAVSS